jgi:hypothetical protein
VTASHVSCSHPQLSRTPATLASTLSAHKHGSAVQQPLTGRRHRAAAPRGCHCQRGAAAAAGSGACTRVRVSLIVAHLQGHFNTELQASLSVTVAAPTCCAVRRPLSAAPPHTRAQACTQTLQLVSHADWFWQQQCEGLGWLRCVRARVCEVSTGMWALIALRRVCHTAACRLGVCHPPRTLPSPAARQCGADTPLHGIPPPLVARATSTLWFEYFCLRMSCRWRLRWELGAGSAHSVPVPGAPPFTAEAGARCANVPFSGTAGR